MSENQQHVIIGGGLFRPSTSPQRDSDGNIAPTPEVNEDGLAFSVVDDTTNVPTAYKGTQEFEAAITTKTVTSFKGALSSPESWRNQYGMSIDGIFMPYTTYFQVDTAFVLRTKSPGLSPRLQSPRIFHQG